ncbi:MAG: hypothetical protein WC716_13020 [Chitinophagaceae bacterium]|jgi:hypothetical protein
MKKLFVRLTLTGLFCAAALSSCKKDKIDTPIDVVTDTEASVQSDDESAFSTHFDAIGNDINNSIEAGGTLITGKTTGTLCDATVIYDSTASDRRITITYDSSASCHPKFVRSGKVIITIPLSVRWKDAGAVVTTTFDKVKITRVKDGKYWILNGNHTIKNVSGGLLKSLSSTGTIKHEIGSTGINITFDDGTTRSWKVAKQRTFTYSSGIVISTIGIHSDGSRSDIAEWGINRKARSFTRAITSPMVMRQDCDFRLVSGATLHTNPAWNATVTFGLDASGAATACPGASGTYYYKIVWTKAGGTTSKTIIAPY